MAVTSTWTDPVSNYDLATGALVTETIWDGVVSDILYANRNSEVYLTNKSGGTLSAGAVVIMDTANDSAFTTTTTAGHMGTIGVVMESIANNASGRVKVVGVASVSTTGTVNRGDYLETSTSAGAAKSAGTAKTDRTFAFALTAASGNVCTALVFSPASIGRLLQVVTTQTGAVATGTTQIPSDDTIPQNTEGDQYMTLDITPKRADSKLIIRVSALVSHTATALAMALFKDSDANALAAVAQVQPANQLHSLILEHRMISDTTSVITFKARIGPASAGTTTFNGVGGARFFGGVIPSGITIMEVAP